MGCLEENPKMGKGKDRAEWRRNKSREIKRKGAGHVSPCYWWVYLLHWTASAQSLHWYLLDILMKSYFLLPSLLQWCTCQRWWAPRWAGWIRGLGASSWSRPQSKGWVLGRLGVQAAGDTYIVCVYSNSSLQPWSARGKERIDPSLFMFLWVLGLFL